MYEILWEIIGYYCTLSKFYNPFYKILNKLLLPQ